MRSARLAPTQAPLGSLRKSSIDPWVTCLARSVVRKCRSRSIPWSETASVEKPARKKRAALDDRRTGHDVGITGKNADDPVGVGDARVKFARLLAGDHEGLIGARVENLGMLFLKAVRDDDAAFGSQDPC